MDTQEPVKIGERTCRKCGKPHTSYRDPLRPNVAPSWADPDDGHAYAPISWEEMYRKAVAA